MGIPIKSVKSFEEDIKWRSNKNWTLVIIANAYSDSRAVDFICRNFHIMDSLSNGVFFYLPGYDVGGFKSPGWALYGQGFSFGRYGSYYEEQTKMEYADSHLRQTTPIMIRSPRLGEIIFNEAEYADFVMEFISKVPGYQYYAACQMVLMPINKERKPDYANAKAYDLDNIINCPSSLSLDAFIHYTFNILRDGRGDVVDEIEKLYHTATTVSFHDDKYEIVVQNVIVDMERCLKYSLKEEFFFISYSSKNVMLAEMLKRTMQDKGINVWIAPDGIPQGRNYSVAVPTAIHFAKSFVLILTRDSANSRWVKRELDVALNNDDTKVRVLLANGYTIDDMRRNNQLNFYLNVVQIKFQYEDILYNEEVFRRFISE